MVDVACKASADTLSTHLPLTYRPAALPTAIYTLATIPGPSISPTLKSNIWALYERNMRTLSEGSSMGWDPREKQRELWHRDSRFIVLRELKPQDDAKGKGKGRAIEKGRGGKEIAAFAMFRFDWEECMDKDWEEDRCEVLYCYELQVAPSARRLGIGKFLVDQLVLLAREYRMRKVMLTCLKANNHALAFYVSQGFSIDPISPSRVALTQSVASEANATTLDGNTEWEDAEEEECDYEILSRRVVLQLPERWRKAVVRRRKAEPGLDDDVVVKACLVAIGVCCSVIAAGYVL